MLRMSTGSGFGPAESTGIIVGWARPQTGVPTAPFVLDYNGDGHADLIANSGTTKE